jgi:hypothetical protein
MNWDRMTPDQREALCGVPYPKVTVCRRPDYTIQYEQVGDCTLVHVNVSRWTPSIKAEYARDVDALQELLDGPVFALCEVRNTKLRKMCVMFGFEPWLDVVTAEGEPAVVLKRNKKHGREPLRRRHAKD